MHLLQVPPQHHDLTLKCTTSGIVILPEGRFRTRYTGSAKHAVDINGKLWESKGELKKHVFQPKDEPKKKRKPWQEKPLVERLKHLFVYKYHNNLSTLKNKLLTFVKDLSPKKETTRRKDYRIHKREVRNRILGMINTSSGKKELYFWTVTFPEKTPDPVAYQLFNIWLTTLRQKKYLKNYIWVAERQKNGTIHYHIAIPHKMPVKVANGHMRVTMVTFAKRGLLPFSVYQCKRYNGIDIAKNRKTGKVTNFAVKKGTRSLVTYLTKYVSKNDETFNHLAWHNSRGYSALFTGITFTLQEFKNMNWPGMVNRAKAIHGKYFTFVPWLNDPPDPITRELYRLNSYLQSLSTKN